MRWLEPDCPPAIMGIVNVTPDSFSDGGRFLRVDAALGQARRMIEEGAESVDIGGESTRPGAERQSAQVQIDRVLPVIGRLHRALPSSVMLSIDTSLAEVAAAALDAGAAMVNDISAGRDDKDMLPLVARRDVPIVLMHMQGQPRDMQDEPGYSDVCAEVRDFLLERVAAAEAAGIAPDRVLIDPGIGFGKRRADNLDLLRDLGKLTALGYPVVLGTSRKRFMGSLCRETDPQQLVGATAATTALGTVAGVRVFRVHDVKINRQAAHVAWSLRLRG